MKNLILLILVILLSLGMVSCEKKTTLYVFNWSDYIDPEIVKEFEKEFNCKVQYSTYDSNENMLTKIKSSRKSFDLVFPSGDHVHILAKEGLLEKLDKAKLPNLSAIDALLLQKAQSFDPANEYAIPYFWGLTGLMYNKQFVADEIIASGSWGMLGNAFFRDKQKVTMLEDAREVVGAALVYSGFNLNDTSDAALAAAKKVLIDWDANITQYDSESYKNEVADGTTWLAQAYNGDAMQQMAQNRDLGFVLPVEGTSMWMDNVVILKNSQNKDLAYKFMDFLMRPEIAKRNAEYVQYPTPNTKAFELLDAEIKNNRIIYPDPQYLNKTYMIEFIGDRVKSIDSIFEMIRMN